MSSQADIMKQLKLKTGVLKRTSKELKMYETERVKEQAKVDKMKAENADPYDIKQAVSTPHGAGNAPVVLDIFDPDTCNRLLLPQEHVLQEAVMMVPETRLRVETAFADLKAHLVRHAGRRFCSGLSSFITLSAAALTLPLCPFTVGRRTTTRTSRKTARSARQRRKRWRTSSRCLHERRAVDVY